VAEAKEAFQLRKQSQPFFQVIKINGGLGRHCLRKGAIEKGNVLSRTLFQIVKDLLNCDLSLVSCSLSLAVGFCSNESRRGIPRTPSAYELDDRNPTFSCLFC
jgi:hypothetical protein